MYTEKPGVLPQTTEITQPNELVQQEARERARPHFFTDIHLNTHTHSHENRRCVRKQPRTMKRAASLVPEKQCTAQVVNGKRKYTANTINT